MLTITEIKAGKNGIRKFEITDLDREVKTSVDKETGVETDLTVQIVEQGTYKVGTDAETKEPIMKEVIFLPKGNSVNQIGIALSKFDAKTKDLVVKTIELNYRQSSQRNSSSAPQSSKIQKFATEEQKVRLAELEALVKERGEVTATEEQIELYKIEMAEYNLAQAYAKRDGVDCTAVRPRNPQSSTGSFIDRLTADEYAEYQAIVEACEIAKKNAPKASRKLSDEEKLDRREKALAEKKALFMAKYGKPTE